MVNPLVMSMLKKSRRVHRGFLLFELMVAVVVLGIALTVVSRSFVSALGALQESSRASKAGLLLEKKIWELTQKGNLSSEKEEGTFDAFGGEFRWTSEVEETEDLPLHQVEVAVQWSAAGRPRDLRVVTYLPKPNEKK